MIFELSRLPSSTLSLSLGKYYTVLKYNSKFVAHVSIRKFVWTSPDSTMRTGISESSTTKYPQ